MADRLERLLSELQDEIASQGPSEEEREKLSVWFNGVLQSERDKHTRNVDLLEALGRAHGLDKGDDDPPAAA